MPRAGLPFGLFAIFLATFPTCDIRAQSPLDAPAEKKITIGSEIARGGEAIIKSLGRKSETPGLLGELFGMEEVVSENRQAKQDSDGFMLGARFNQWFALDFFLNRSGGLKSYSKPSEIAECQHAALKYFEEMRELQKTLGISDQNLFQALGIKDAAKLAKIEERLKAYEALR